MWPSNAERNAPFREFSTPPATWRKPPHCPTAAMPMSETRRRAPAAGGSGCSFHVIHKVPSGDSPYARAKHVQLVEKDPSKAVALFWAAINAGDRVDSALKDMAVVMKQLDRSDEAVEAIKSFRCLCPHDSQESLDNVLIDLYKRSGKIEEEIKMLQQMLKNIEEEIAVFGGSRTKIARSQGKKVQITAVQEKARILGNLAWAYLQQHNYGFAEQHYRKAMLLEPDRNKQCNLALCLMHMNRIPEAKSLLEEVRMASGGKEQMDESYAKSYERASQVLAKLESAPQAGIEKKEHDEGSSSFPSSLTQETTRSTSDKLASGICSSSQSCLVNDWSRSHYFESPSSRSDSVDRWVITPGTSTQQNCNVSPAAVLYTQPRMDPRRSDRDNQKSEALGVSTVPRPSDKLLSRTIRNLSGELDSTDAKAEMKQQRSMSGFPSPGGGAWGRSWNVQCTQHPSWKNNDPGTGSWRKPSIVVGNVSVPLQQVTAAADKFGNLETTAGPKQEFRCQDIVPATRKSTDKTEEKSIQEIGSSKYTGKSWADIVEEEEEAQKLSAMKPVSDHRFSDENSDCNQMLGGVNLNGGCDTPRTAMRSGHKAVRRYLSFEADKDNSTIKWSRLKVFQDITPYPDSP